MLTSPVLLATLASMLLLGGFAQPDAPTSRCPEVLAEDAEQAEVQRTYDSGTTSSDFACDGRAARCPV